MVLARPREMGALQQILLHLIVNLFVQSMAHAKCSPKAIAKCRRHSWKWHVHAARLSTLLQAQPKYPKTFQNEKIAFCCELQHSAADDGGGDDLLEDGDIGIAKSSKERGTRDGGRPTTQQTNLKTGVFILHYITIFIVTKSSFWQKASPFFFFFMHQYRSISLFPTPFDHFHFHPFPRLIWWVLLFH